MVEKINTLCDQIYEDIQNLRKSGNYDVEKRLGVEIMALNALSNAYAKTGQNLVHPATWDIFRRHRPDSTSVTVCRGAVCMVDDSFSSR